MRRKYLPLILVLLVMFFGTSNVGAHCEVPCGIYDDEMRVRMIAEHITTIEKAMTQITQLQSQKPTNDNQLTRWVMNKEYHANEVQQIVAQYFMTQRIKLDAVKYSDKVTLLHKILVYAMKCKQTTDLTHITTLRSLLKEFQGIYFGGSHK
ncbi:MAG: superoxide dismutase [Desulfobacterales bacterium]|nr:MAG: superoxide dismutase [Desulfobacterales bacterium]